MKNKIILFENQDVKLEVNMKDKKPAIKIILSLMVTKE